MSAEFDWDMFDMADQLERRSRAGCHCLACGALPYEPDFEFGSDDVPVAVCPECGSEDVEPVRVETASEIEAREANR